MKVPTIAIVWPSNRRGGFVHINLSDFDPAVHQVYDPNAPRPEPPADVSVIPVTPGPAAETADVVVPDPALPVVSPEPVAPVAETPEVPDPVRVPSKRRK